MARCVIFFRSRAPKNFHSLGHWAHLACSNLGGFITTTRMGVGVIVLAIIFYHFLLTSFFNEGHAPDPGYYLKIKPMF